MIVYNEYDFRVPSFLMTGIINGDSSGYTEEDEDTLAAVIKHFNKLTPKCGHWTLEIPAEDNESYFTSNPDFINLGCDVYDLKLTIFI